MAAEASRTLRTEIAGLARTLDLKLPDSPLVKAAYEHAEEISDPWLFNHVVRSWLFAAALAQSQQLKHDAELLAASTLLHDIGLTEAFRGEVRFEVFGAELRDVVGDEWLVLSNSYRGGVGEHFASRCAPPIGSLGRSHRPRDSNPSSVGLGTLP
jgi:hypothetical protein